jgi:hypothetical protein
MNTEKFIEELKAFQKRTDEIIKELSAEKPQELTRETGMPKLDNNGYWIDSYGGIKTYFGDVNSDYGKLNSFKAVKEAETERDYTLASRRVRAWAKAVNGDWKADWRNKNQNKYGVSLDNNQLCIDSDDCYNWFIHQICFPTEELATKFLELFRPELEILANP